MDRHADEIAVPEALPDLGGALGERKRRGRVAGEPQDRGLEERREAELDAVGQFIRVSLHAGEPPGADRRLVPQEVLHAEASRHPRGSALVARLRVSRVGLLPGGDRLLHPPGPPGRVGEAFRVLAARGRTARGRGAARTHRTTPSARPPCVLGRSRRCARPLRLPGVERPAPESGTAYPRRRQTHIRMSAIDGARSSRRPPAQPRSIVSGSGCLSHTAVPAATGARSSTTIADRLALAPQAVRPTARQRSALTGRAISAVR